MPVANGMYYSQYDGGSELPAVILIHGAGSNHSCWPAELRRLSGRKVLAVDLPGHGRSGGAALQSIRAYAEEMLNFLQAVGMYKAVFIGHSMGGAVALTLGLDFPEHVAGLGVISAGSYLPVPAEITTNFSNSLTVTKGRRILEQMAFSSKASPALVQSVMRALSAERVSVTYLDWLACANFDLSEKIQLIEAPVWAACGLDDRLIPPALTSVLASQLPRAFLQEVADAGHMVIVEKPEALRRGVVEFLERVKMTEPEYRWQVDQPIVKRRNL